MCGASAALLKPMVDNALYEVRESLVDLNDLRLSLNWVPKVTNQSRRGWGKMRDADHSKANGQYLCQVGVSKGEF